MEKQRFGHIETPLKRVHIELTNVCEFNCRFCPKPDMERKYGYMDKGLAKRIISEIAQNNIAEKITFHVMGEPTMHPDFFEFLDHAASEGINVGLTTNGKNLGGPVGKRLAEYPLHQIDVSFQTPDEVSFELREAGNLAFDDYLKGILDFFCCPSGQLSGDHFQVPIPQHPVPQQDDGEKGRADPGDFINGGASENI